MNVAGSSPAKARAFAERFGIAGWSEGVSQLLADPGVEAVYIATPHPSHEHQALTRIAAGKHVLCEKPLTLDEPSAARVLDAAKRQGVFVMEAFMYRCHPLLRELLALLKDGAIGAIRHVRADFGFRVPRMPEHRLFNLALGGGHPRRRRLSCLLRTLDRGDRRRHAVRGAHRAHGQRSDRTDRGRRARQRAVDLPLRIDRQSDQRHLHDVGTTAVVFGEHGKIVLPDPDSGQPATVHGQRADVFRDGQDPEQVVVRTDQATYAIEAELVLDTLPAIEASWPAMSHADTLGNMRVLDASASGAGRKTEGTNSSL